MNIYTLFDKIDGRCSQIFTAPSDARVVRDFTSSVTARNKDLESKKFPLIQLSDYEIRLSASYDEFTGVVTPVVPPAIVPFDAN